MKREKTPILFCMMLWLLSAPIFAWDRSEYQIELCTSNRSRVLEEFENSVREANKTKAFEAYQIFRFFDPFDSREMFSTFEQKFGGKNYESENLEQSSKLSDSEEAAVIIAVLNEMKNTSHFVVVSESLEDFSTFSTERLKEDKEKISEMVSEVWCCYNSFIKFNTGEKHICVSIPGENKISEISLRKLRLYFPLKGRHYWEEFKKRYPGADGYYKFSKVGFDKNLEKAFLQMEAVHERGFFYGQFLYLEKIDGKWKKVCNRGLYIS